MENYQRVKELTEESANSAGTADKKYEAYMDSMAAATKRLENAWESFTMKLESSKVLRLTSEAIAGIVENMDKLLPMVFALLTAMKSSNILKFFTGGEGGFASGGLGKIIGAVTGNRSITMNANGELAQTQTFRWRITSSLDEIKQSLYKIAYGTEPGVGDNGTVTFSRMAHRKEWKDYKFAKKLGLAVEDKDLERQHAAYIADFKQRAASVGLAAGVGAATRLVETRNIGGSGVAALINKTGQTVEEDAGDKALGVGLKAAGSLLGLTPLGPLGAMLGQVMGDNVADIISFFRHKGELEEKQRIAQAKENLEKLSSIDSSITSIGEEALKDNEDVDWDKLDDFIYNLYQSISDYNGGVNEFINSINNLDKSVNSLGDLYEKLRSNDEKEREQAYYATLYAAAKAEYDNLVGNDELAITGTQEESRKNISSIKLKDIIKDIVDEQFVFESQRLGVPATQYSSDLRHSLEEKFSGIDSVSLDDQAKRWMEYLETAEGLSEETLRIINQRIEELNTYSAQEKNLDKDKREAALKASFAAPIGVDKDGYQKYLGQYTNYELQAIGPEELYRLISKNLKEFGTDIRYTAKEDAEHAGEIKKEWKDYLNSYIQENYSAVLSYDQRTLSQLQKSRDELDVILKYLGVTDGSLRKQYETDNITTDLKGYDESLIGGLLSATDSQKVKDFAKAWGYTVEQFEELAESGSDVYNILLNLSEAQGMMSPTEVTEYYKGFSSILSDITESLSLSKDSLQNIINNYPQLLKYFKQEGDFLTVTSELYKTLMDEQNFVYKNAVKNAYMSSAPMFGDFKNKNLTPEQRAVIDQNSISTFDSLVTAINEGKISASIIDAARQYLDMDLTYKVDNPLLNSAMEYENKIIDKQISALEEQKKALEDVNSVREKELQLIKAKQKLEDAKTNKQIVYREGVGFVYEANQDAVQQAQKEIEDLESQRTAENVQREIDQLNLAKDILSNMTEENGMLSLKNSFDALQKAISGNGGDESGGLSAQIALLNKAYQDGTATVNLSDSFLQDIEGDEASKGFLPEIEGSVSYIEEIMGKNNSLLEKIAEAVVAENIAKEIERKKSDYILGSDKTFVSVIEDVFKEYGISTNSLLYKDILSDNEAFIRTDERKREERENSYKEMDEILEPLEEAGDVVQGIRDGFEKFDKGMQTVGGILTIASWFKSLLPHADGITSTPSDQTALINEVGTEAIITPEGTITSLPSKTGIIPADITKNLWALGEVAPNLVARLGSLSTPKMNSNIGNTTYEEGQYIDSLTMNVYPTKDYDMDRLLAEARSKVKLTKHNH